MYTATMFKYAAYHRRRHVLFSFLLQFPSLVGRTRVTPLVHALNDMHEQAGASMDVCRWPIFAIHGR